MYKTVDHLHKKLITKHNSTLNRMSLLESENRSIYVKNAALEAENSVYKGKVEQMSAVIAQQSAMLNSLVGYTDQVQPTADNPINQPLVQFLTGLQPAQTSNSVIVPAQQQVQVNPASFL